MGKDLVIALGGNALGKTPYEQRKIIVNTAEAIVELVEEGYNLIISHGNGPQVGMINVAFDYAAGEGIIASKMPIAECGAMSQGYIGYHLQNAIYNSLRKRNMNNQVVSLVTQVVVDRKDPAFNNPTKPIGMFYSYEEAEILKKEKNYTMIEDAGRGYRRVIASPKPLRIVEIESIRMLAQKDFIVICGGGGGIPVVNSPQGLIGKAAVVDKDFAAAKIAEEMKADILLILTSIDSVCINYGKPEQRELRSLSISEAEKYVEEKQFAAGSMLPKIEAAISFAKHGGEAIIASLDNAKEALKGNSGTLIHI